VGQTHLLQHTRVFQHKKTRHLALDKILADGPGDRGHHVSTQTKYANHRSLPKTFDDGVINRMDWEFPELNFRKAVVNTDRNIGTGLAGEVVRRFGIRELADDTIQLHLKGTAGQSLGAFLCQGISVSLRGEANDYVGKGMAGGNIVLQPLNPLDRSNHQVIAGNAVLYGATGGAVFAAGQVAERFCVRNSGAVAVVEGCGDHGCEYMTRGTAVVLGVTGNNFAAGMTGGEAFVLDLHGQFNALCNQQTVMILEPDEQALNRAKKLIETFSSKTESAWGAEILSRWDKYGQKICQVVPRELITKPPESKPFIRDLSPPKMLADRSKTGHSGG